MSPTPQANPAPLKVLFAASEALPLIKTGGLADVSGSLPGALRGHGHDVRLVLPAYPAALRRAGPVETVATLRLPGVKEPVRILAGTLPGSGLPFYLVSAHEHFDRGGNPYTDLTGHDWGDNADRFDLFCRKENGLPANCGVLREDALERLLACFIGARRCHAHQ